MSRDARTLRVVLWENKCQIARGLSDEILRFSQRNMSRDARTLRVVLF
ncbi:MAG: hypothetical protein F6K40_12975 [Okeania sp. SIO3I5]|nr:hypothetical protein [Okeania sp. SIO3I5]NEQ37127.1 hypothetical protein [Okeania sp. SIO3I5]